MVQNKTLDKTALVIGFGAMGHYGAWHLHQLGFCIYADRQKESLQEASIWFQSHCFQFPVLRFESNKVKHIDLLILAVKAFDLTEVWINLKKIARKTSFSNIVVIANGHILPLLKQFSLENKSLNWNIGLSTVGVSNLDKFEIMSPSGQITIGPIDTCSDRSTLDQSFIELFKPPFLSDQQAVLTPQIIWRYTNDVRYEYFSKWLINAVLNTLCAAKSLKKNKYALEEKPLLWSLHQEAYRWYREKMDPAQAGNIDLDMSFERLLDIIHRTAENENSMARDFRLGKNTENLFLAGLVLSEAQGEVKYPHLHKLATFIEQKRVI